jgi:hypothetical protein
MNLSHLHVPLRLPLVNLLPDEQAPPDVLGLEHSVCAALLAEQAAVQQMTASSPTSIVTSALALFQGQDATDDKQGWPNP